MAGTYCTPTDVANFLALRDSNGNRLVLGPTTNPTSAEVDALIEETEDFIDSYIGTTFKVKQVFDELHRGDSRRRDKWNKLSYMFRLRKYPVVALSSVNGDKFEVWDGSSWVDWLAAGDMGQAPYDKKFYVSQSGKVIVSDGNYARGPVSFKVTYRYGFNAVPKDIKRATILLVAAELYRTQLQEAIFPRGDLEIDRQDVSVKYEEQAFDILSRYYRPVWV